MKDYIDQIYPLSYIIRYSNIPRIKDESVAEHSFYVAAIVQKLYDKYRFNLGVALNMAISHDMIEVYVNDIPHLIKKRHPDLTKLLKDIESKEAENFPSCVEDGVRRLQHESYETMIVKMADAIQCNQYASNEISLGNSGYMQEVIKHSVKRVKDLEEKCEIILRGWN